MCGQLLGLLMAQESHGASRLKGSPGSVCFGRRRLGGLGSDHAKQEAGRSEDGGRGQETQTSSGSCKNVLLLPRSPSPPFK